MRLKRESFEEAAQALVVNLRDDQLDALLAEAEASATNAPVPFGAESQTPGLRRPDHLRSLVATSLPLAKKVWVDSFASWQSHTCLGAVAPVPWGFARFTARHCMNFRIVWMGPDDDPGAVDHALKRGVPLRSPKALARYLQHGPEMVHQERLSSGRMVKATAVDELPGPHCARHSAG